MNTDQGIVILGAPRSGTTLLRRILNAHARIYCPGETNIFVGCAKLVRQDVVKGGLPIGMVEGAKFMGYDEAVIINRIREFAVGFLNEKTVEAGKSRWCEKTAFNSFYIPELERILGADVQYICIVRHGLDVATSLVDLCNVNGGFLPEIHNYVQRFPQLLDAFVHMWVDLSQQIETFHRRMSENSMLVRYEDLVSSPQAQMKSILEFLHESIDDDLVSRALQSQANVGIGDWKTYGKAEIDSASVARWRGLADADLARLGKIANPMLKKLGYDQISVNSCSEEAARAYKIGLLVQGLKKSK